MTIETRDFGAMELDESEMLEFVTPVYGFERYTRYALLSDDEAGPGFMWLQSVNKAEVCFIVLDPEEIGLDYRPELSAQDALQLGLDDGQAVVRVMAVVPEDFRDTTVNLKSPVVINQKNKRAAQVILDADYPIRLRLFDREGEVC